MAAVSQRCRPKESHRQGYPAGEDDRRFVRTDTRAGGQGSVKSMTTFNIVACYWSSFSPIDINS